MGCGASQPAGGVRREHRAGGGGPEAAGPSQRPRGAQGAGETGSGKGGASAAAGGGGSGEAASSGPEPAATGIGHAEVEVVKEEVKAEGVPEVGATTAGEDGGTDGAEEHEARKLFDRFDLDGDGFIDKAEMAALVEGIGMVPFGGSLDEAVDAAMGELAGEGGAERISLADFLRQFAVFQKMRAATGIDHAKMELMKERLLEELGHRGCLLRPGEEPASGSPVEGRAVSLVVVEALEAALTTLGDYDLPTFNCAIRSMCTGPPPERRRVRLVDLLRPHLVGAPAAFVSHMWTAPLGAWPGSRPFLFQSERVLGHYAAQGGLAKGSAEWEATRVWLDVFAVSQHPGGEQVADLGGLHRAVDAAGGRDGTLVLLDERGRTLTRIWCLLEIWRTVESGGAGALHILSSGMDGGALKEVFVTLDVEKAEATLASDRERILAEFRASGTPPSELNRRIKEALVESARLEAAPLMGLETCEAADALTKLGVMLRECMARYAEAEPLYLRALAIREEALGGWHRDVGDSCYNLAVLYADQGKYAEAEPLHLRAIAIREKALGKDHPDVGGSCNRLGVLYKAQGKYAEAEPLYLRAIAIREKALGREHPDVVGPCNNLAGLYMAQRKHAEAEPLYTRALGIREKALGPDHPDVGSLCNNLATLLKARGKYAEAVPLYLRAVSILEKALGPDHPNVGDPCSNLANLYFKAQGKHAQAEPLYLRALAIREKALGPDHPKVGVSCSTLATLYDSQEKYAEAEALYLRALAIREKALGPDHLESGASCYYLANLYNGMGKYAEAEPLYLRALAVREKALGPDHRDVGDACYNLAVLYAAWQGKYAEAERLHLRALRIFEGALGEGHEEVADSCTAIAALYEKMGRGSDAEPLHRRAQQIRGAQ